MVALFAAAMFINALLLFIVQPMFAKLLLPQLGGSPAVWTTCMLFFQSALLAGYAYSHSLAKLRTPWQQALIHASVIAVPMLTLPIALSMTASASGSPITSVLQLSLVTVGAPFFALATSAPLLQRWFALAQHRRPVDPYFLYAASNVGSFASLILYPTIIEPAFALSTQTRVWSLAYSVAAALTVVCALVMWRRAPAVAAPSNDDASTSAITWRRRTWWIALAFVPSSLMLGVTAYLSTDVAAMPLLWVIPLALYLVTFVITFSTYSTRALAVGVRVFPFALLYLTWLILSQAPLPLAATAATHLIAFFVIAILCHGTLAHDRPSTAHLTDFYLSLAVGGALGGVFNSLLAPLLFRSVLEYPLALAAAVALLAFRTGTAPLRASRRWWLRPAIACALTAVALFRPGADFTVAMVMWALLTAAVVVGFSVSRQPRQLGITIIVMLALSLAFGGRRRTTEVVEARRTFFGTYRVASDRDHRSFLLFHGTTLHGQQHVGSDEPLTYYHRDSPIAQVFASRPAGTVTNVGAVGLGTGTLAAYAQPGQHWTFYEIDPEVERIARDARHFTHLSRCGDRCRVIIGDARLSLQESSETHDLIVLDAFSSDAIPVHLLTREAVELYLSRLNPGGVIAIHISNRHLRLSPVVAGIGRDLGLVGREQLQSAPKDAESGRLGSHWTVLARTEADLGSMAGDKRWKALQPRNGLVWTDDFSNIWSLIQWQ